MKISQTYESNQRASQLIIKIINSEFYSSDSLYIEHEQASSQALVYNPVFLVIGSH